MEAEEEEEEEANGSDTKGDEGGRELVRGTEEKEMHKLEKKYE